MGGKDSGGRSWPRLALRIHLSASSKHNSSHFSESLERKPWWGARGIKTDNNNNKREGNEEKVAGKYTDKSEVKGIGEALTEWKGRGTKINFQLRNHRPSFNQRESVGLSPDEPEAKQLLMNTDRGKMHVWPGGLFFILNPALSFLEHLGSNSAQQVRRREILSVCLAGLHPARALLSHLRSVGDFRLIPQEMVPVVV